MKGPSKEELINLYETLPEETLRKLGIYKKGGIRMLDCNTKQGLTERSFELIIDWLLNDLEIRRQFLNAPEDVLRQFNIYLTPEEINKIKEINLEIRKDMVNFNEKLVLCSSSGY